MIVGTVLFRPALFFSGSGSDLEPQLAAMKGNCDPLTAAGMQNGCFNAQDDLRLVDHAAEAQPQLVR